MHESVMVDSWTSFLLLDDVTKELEQLSRSITALADEFSIDVDCECEKAIRTKPIVVVLNGLRQAIDDVSEELMWKRHRAGSIKARMEQVGKELNEARGSSCDAGSCTDCKCQDVDVKAAEMSE